jgi:hypothetical protein
MMGDKDLVGVNFSVALRDLLSQYSSFQFPVDIAADSRNALLVTPTSLVATLVKNYNLLCALITGCFFSCRSLATRLPLSKVGSNFKVLGMRTVETRYPRQCGIQCIPDLTANLISINRMNIGGWEFYRDIRRTGSGSYEL